MTDVGLAAAAVCGRAAGVVPAARLTLPGEDGDVAPLVLRAVVVCDTPGVSGGGGCGAGLSRAWSRGATLHSLREGPVADRSYGRLVPGGGR